VSEALPQLNGALTQSGKLIDAVLITHGPITFCTNRSQVIDICSTSFTFGNVVSHLEIKWGYHIFTPCNQTFMFKEPVSAKREPHLFPQRTWDFNLHPLNFKTLYLYNLE
jgi:hypothetical protein